MHRRILIVALALMIALAGCSGGPGATTAPSDAADDVPDDETTSEQMIDGSTGGSQAGTVQFYISDEENDIGDFEHLNATVTTVQFHYVGPTNDSDDSEDEPGTTESPETTATDSPETTTVVVTTAEPEGEGQEQAEGEKGNDEEDEKEDEDEEDEEDEKDEEDEEDGEEAEDGEDDGEGQARWIERDLNDTTVDLTELQGQNATLLENMSMPAGKYTQVRLVVSEVNGTLNDGSDQRVKLPSSRLKLNKPFTLGANDSVQFVFDITIHEAGKSGKYILKPVAGESGTDQEIERVDAKAKEERGKDKGEAKDR